MIMKIIVLLMIMSTYFKTEKSLPIAITWGVLSFFMRSNQIDWMWSMTLSVIAFLVIWGVFELAKYLEESIFLRLVVLLVGMMAMLVI